LGRAAAEEQLDEINAYLDGAHMCFITAGMGGGTGTGAAPVIARIARERGILTVGVVTKPFQFEGPVRSRAAEAGIQDLQQYVDTLIVIPNQNLFRIANEKTTWTEAFKLADNVLYQGVRGVTDLIMTPGQINLDFADIRSVMSEMGKAMMGTGEAEGDNRALQAAEMAINNPLLDDASVKGARGVLINITGGNDLTLFEVEEAANRIRDEVDQDANIIFGTALDPNMEGRIRISVVATGIDLDVGRQRPPISVIQGGAGSGAYTPNQPQQQQQPQMAQQQVRAQQGASLFSQAAAQASAQQQPKQAVNTGVQPGFYAGLQAESVSQPMVASAPQMQQQAQQMEAPRARAQATQPLRGTRQDGQFVAPQPVQVTRPSVDAYAPVPPFAPAASAQARRPSFGERMVSKVKNFVRQMDGEGDEQMVMGVGPQGQAYAAVPQSQSHAAQHPQQQQQQAPRGYEVTQGGKAGLPPVEDIELDIPSFLRRQAN